MSVDIPRYFPLMKATQSRKGSAFADGKDYPLTKAEREAISMQNAYSLQVTTKGGPKPIEDLVNIFKEIGDC